MCSPLMEKGGRGRKEGNFGNGEGRREVRAGGDSTSLHRCRGLSAWHRASPRNGIAPPLLPLRGLSGLRFWVQCPLRDLELGRGRDQQPFVSHEFCRPVQPTSDFPLYAVRAAAQGTLPTSTLGPQRSWRRPSGPFWNAGCQGPHRQKRYLLLGQYRSRNLVPCTTSNISRSPRPFKIAILPGGRRGRDHRQL
jgi:hypothetical protein